MQTISSFEFQICQISEIQFAIWKYKEIINIYLKNLIIAKLSSDTRKYTSVMSAM